MKKISRACLLVFLVLVVGFCSACNRYSHESVNRTIVGQLVAIDRYGQTSTLEFRDGTSVVVSNGSLSHWNTAKMIAGGGTWVFKLHTVNHVIYDVVSISGNLPLQGPTSPAIISTTTLQPIEIVLVQGPLPPINPGGPIVEITVKNTSSENVVLLSIMVQLGRVFTYNFDVTSSNPLSPGESTSSKMTLIGGGFSTDATYSFTIDGTLQNGQTFSYNQQARIVTP